MSRTSLPESLAVDMHLAYCLSVLLLVSLGNASAASEDASKYTAGLHFEGMGYRCSAAIIAEDLLVTSGECFASKMNSPVKVPSINVVAEGVGGKVEARVSRVYLPYFYAGRFRTVHDFAVVKLKEKLNLRENGLVALRLPARSIAEINEYEGTVGYVSTARLPDTERVEVVDFRDCGAYVFHLLMPNSQFCTKYEYHDSNRKCSGDRGSPIVEGDDLLIGVQLECNANASYELFAKISHFRDIIDSVMAGTPGPYSTHTYA